MRTGTNSDTKMISKHVGGEQFDVVVNPKDCHSVFSVATNKARRGQSHVVRLTCMEYDGVILVGNTDNWIDLTRVALDDLNPSPQRVGTMFSVEFDLSSDHATFLVPSLTDAVGEAEANRMRSRFVELDKSGVLERLFSEDLLDEVRVANKH